MPRMADAPAVLVGALGGSPYFGASSRAFSFGQWRFEGGGRLEIIEPRGEDGFLHRFLASHGPGIHHVTFKVPSLRDACDRAEHLGYDVVGYDDSDPRWSEAFLHPKRALGIVVQLVQTSFTGEPRRRWQGPPGPDKSPPPVRIVGLRMRAHSRERAHTQWETLLGGDGTRARDGLLIYRWPESPLRIAVEIDAAADEGPTAVEYTALCPLSLPSGPHPVLGVTFAHLAAAR